MTAVRLKPATKALLLEIYGAKPTSEAPFTIKDRDAEPAKDLVAKAFVLYNETAAAKDPATGKNTVAAILTEAGTTKAASYGGGAPAAPRGPLPNPDDFEILTGIEIPDFKRGGPVRAIYPFERMTAVGMSFFIPQPEGVTNTVKAKQSTISAHNKRVQADFEARIAAGGPDAPAAGERPPLFKIGPYTMTKGDGTKVEGAMVWRVENPAPTPAA